MNMNSILKSFILSFFILSAFAQKCPQDDIWPETNPGQAVVLPCDDTVNYEGSNYRYCQSSPTQWSEPVYSCYLKPIHFSYPLNDYVFSASDEITITPTLTGGNIDSVTIIPSLPEGLNLNANTGVISGSVVVMTPTRLYYVTAQNDIANVTITISLAIAQSKCEADSVWLATYSGVTAYVECGEGKIGFMSRVCGGTLLQALWNDPDSSLCISYSESDEPPENKLFAFVPIYIKSTDETLFDLASNKEIFRLALIQAYVDSVPSTSSDDLKTTMYLISSVKTGSSSDFTYKFIYRFIIGSSEEEKTLFKSQLSVVLHSFTTLMSTYTQPLFKLITSCTYFSNDLFISEPIVPTEVPTEAPTEAPTVAPTTIPTVIPPEYQKWILPGYYVCAAIIIILIIIIIIVCIKLSAKPKFKPHHTPKFI